MTSDNTAPHHLDQVLADVDALIDVDGVPELEAVKTALTIEDVFGIQLSDNDIDALTPPDGVAIRDVVRRAQSRR